MAAGLQHWQEAFDWGSDEKKGDIPLSAQKAKEALWSC
jgi:hypothetical protein